MPPKRLIGLSGTGHELHTLDLTHKTDIDRFWAELSANSLPDILINNAGIYPMKDFFEVDEE